MKRTVKRISVIAIMGIMLTSAYLIGTTKATVIPDTYIDITSEDFKNNYLDMRDVIDYKAYGNGLQLYCNDGNGYYWER